MACGLVEGLVIGWGLLGQPRWAAPSSTTPWFSEIGAAAVGPCTARLLCLSAFLSSFTLRPLLCCTWTCQAPYKTPHLSMVA